MSFAEIRANISLFVQQDKSYLANMLAIAWMAKEGAEALFGHPNVQRLLDPKDGRKFDLAMIDLFLSESQLYLGSHFGVPTIAISVISMNEWSNSVTGMEHSCI